MGLALKSPPCCCRSLRTASLILLYIHLVMYGFALLSQIPKKANDNSSSAASLFQQALDMSSTHAFIYLLFEVSAFVVFLITVITIYKEKSSVHMLTASACILLVSVIYSLYVMITFNLNGNFERFWKDYADEYVKNTALNEEQREAFKNAMASLVKPFKVFMTVLLLGDLIFVLYSVWIFHSYKEELKQKPVYGVPPQQYNPEDKEANVSAPYPPNAQFVTAPYPTQPSNPNQPPPQNYIQPPPY